MGTPWRCRVTVDVAPGSKQRGGTLRTGDVIAKTLAAAKLDSNSITTTQGVSRDVAFKWSGIKLRSEGAGNLRHIEVCQENASSRRAAFVYVPCWENVQRRTGSV